MCRKKFVFVSLLSIFIVLTMISIPYSKISAQSSEYSSEGTSAFPITINGLGYGINVKAADIEHLSDNSCDVYFQDGEIEITNGGRIEKIPLSSLSVETIDQAFSPYNMKIQLSAETDTVYVVYSRQNYAAAFILTYIDITQNSYQGIGVSTTFDNRSQLAEALKYQIANPSQSDVSENTASNENSDSTAEHSNVQDQPSIDSTNSNDVVDINEKEININLSGIDNGINLQSGTMEPVSGNLTDFYINNGRIICLNGARVNNISIDSIDDSSISQALAIDQLKTEIEASKNSIYIVISPRGCIGVVRLTDIDRIKNVYKGVALSSPLDNALKRHIVETTSSSEMDIISSGDMDVIETGEMDVISTGDYDYFDTEISLEINKIVFNDKKVKFQVSPRKYENGEILVLLNDIAPLFKITVTSEVNTGIETTILKKGNTIASIEAYSDSATVGSKTITLKKAAKMDNKGIMVPLSFLSNTFNIHFSISEDSKSIVLSNKEIIEWRYSGYQNKKPYKEYETMFKDGIKTSKTRLNGKNHVFKNVTLYNKKTGKKMVVLENEVDLYKKGWSTTPPTNESINTNDITDPNNAFFTRINTKNFFKSSTFNTWGGNMIRRIVP